MNQLFSVCYVAVISRISFSCGVVAARVGGTSVPHLLGEGRLKPSSPLDAMRNSSTESSFMAHHKDETLLRVEPMKAVPELPLLGERLRPPK
jgi:hypothetical protein